MNEADAEVQALIDRLRQPRPKPPEEPIEYYEVPDVDWRWHRPNEDVEIQIPAPSRTVLDPQ